MPRLEPKVETHLEKAEGDKPAGIRLLIEQASILEHRDTGELAPSALLTRGAALALAYRLGELAQKLPAD